MLPENIMEKAVSNRTEGQAMADNETRRQLRMNETGARCQVHEARIGLVEKTLERTERNTDKRLESVENKIDRIDEKIDKFNNGGFSKAVQAQNEKLVSAIISRQDGEMDIVHNNQMIKLKKWKLALGILGIITGSGIINHLIGLLIGG